VQFLHGSVNYLIEVITCALSRILGMAVQAIKGYLRAKDPVMPERTFMDQFREAMRSCVTTGLISRPVGSSPSYCRGMS